MNLVDSHCHLNCLDLTEHAGELDVALLAAKDVGVQHMLCVCIDLENFPAVLAIAEQHDNITASVGLHPTERSGQEPEVEDLVRLSDHPKVVAIGETGLDYYRCTDDNAWQRERFLRHIEAAKMVQKPLIIHSRAAKEDTLSILRAEEAWDVKGVMHCFTEDWDMAKKAIDLGFYISFSGIVTFRNAVELKEVAQKVPLDRMLIETDSPYLAPTPHRGKPNEPAYVRFVAEHIAELRGVPVEEIAEQTTANFFELFKGARA